MSNKNVNNNSIEQGNVKKTSSKKKAKKSFTEQVLSPNSIRKGLKHSAGFTGSLLINVLIVFMVIKVFSYAFNFTYSIFGDVCMSPGDTEYVVVEIPADSSILEIGQALEDGGVIKDKYVFFAKVKVKGYGDQIKTGKFGLSASMNYDEILEIICDLDTEEEE
ncbi:MAG: endolytic transglycosylase MltG [Lachnospiraceae bacterium]|nr:endolytic transglycosylase MltG [Lachnospiraceae bacterium]